MQTCILVPCICSIMSLTCKVQSTYRIRVCNKRPYPWSDMKQWFQINKFNVGTLFVHLQTDWHVIMTNLQLCLSSVFYWHDFLSNLWLFPLTSQSDIIVMDYITILDFYQLTSFKLNLPYITWYWQMDMTFCPAQFNWSWNSIFEQFKKGRVWHTCRSNIRGPQTTVNILFEKST